MPCGGIVPIKQSVIRSLPDLDSLTCWVCNKPNCELWCEEWDTPLHKACLKEFLASEEGKVIIDHQHLIYDGETIIQEET